MNIEIIREEHLFTSDQKLKWFGDGEWVEEFDKIEFKYREYECLIERVCYREPFAKHEHYFGGHLCGYVKISPNHVLFGKNFSEFSELINCHGGITYNQYDENHWIGFDCAHSYDILPSLVKTREQINENMKKMMPDMFKDSILFTTEYRNIDFVIAEIKNIVDQLVELQTESKIP